MPAAASVHDAGCVPSSADPATVTRIDLRPAGGPLLYIEERGVEPPLAHDPPVPASGLLAGDGTSLYGERNGLAGLQRGGIALVGPCFPPQPFPCVRIDDDPVNDENCGHGPDSILAWIESPF